MPESKTEAEPCELDYLAVSCDELPFCDATLSGDFKVRVADGKAARLGYVLAYATREGWHVETPSDPLGTKTYCPRHKVA